MAVEQTYIKVYCPHNGRICKVPIGMTNTLAVVQNTCDFSNGALHVKLVYIHYKV